MITKRLTREGLSRKTKGQWQTAFVLFVLLLSVLASEVQAAELRTYGQTIRSLGMGGVRVADGNEATVIFWNPAGLADVKGLRLDIFNLGFGTNSYQNIREFQDIGTINDLTDLDPIYGVPLNAGLNGYAAAAVPSFGVGIYTEGIIDAVVHNPSFPELNMTYFNDYGYSVGGAAKFGDLRLGGAFKRVTRKGGYHTIGADLLENLDTSTLLDQFQDEGTAYAVDLGMLYRVDAPFNPTLSVAWQNFAKTAMQKTAGLSAPEGLEDNMTVGFTINSDVGIGGMAAGIEYRHLGKYQEDPGKKLHMGAELSLMNLDLRAGFSQGYTTYGASLDLFFVQLDAAIYSVEKGAYSGQTPDQRINVGLSMSFGFDPDFSLVSLGGSGGAGGAKRRLKQRR